jgi:hypothetical protein
MNNQIICDGCGFYKDKFFINKHKSGKNYCNGCSLIVNREPSEVRIISQEEFNKMLKIALSTQPLKLKDLRLKLKKEREKKKRLKGKKGSK